MIDNKALSRLRNEISCLLLLLAQPAFLCVCVWVPEKPKRENRKSVRRRQRTEKLQRDYRAGTETGGTDRRAGQDERDGGRTGESHTPGIKSDRTHKAEKREELWRLSAFTPLSSGALSAIRVLRHSRSHLPSDSFTLHFPSLSLNLCSPCGLTSPSGPKPTLFLYCLEGSLHCDCGAVTRLLESARFPPPGTLGVVTYAPVHRLCREPPHICAGRPSDVHGHTLT